ncbi:PREDICTED: uncharacterized protein LOC108358629 [Rhagoletis zephyria]|uniref:uncharacterized protein LOC108358629 n=1 Tax=Rhagoletis zephyria TaxID=28612 RepID=UPI0008113BE9|nr:PREDICTED: uncharacterized protein LOC108358629 [Rhagoletis zephyria]XP_036341989.1 uncharacterized protein LOC118751317 [Rhagoletis pomonella]
MDGKGVKIEEPTSNKAAATEGVGKSTAQKSTAVKMSGSGNLEPFDLSQLNKWSTYMERFNLFLLANDVQEEGRKKAVFLTLAGPPLYDLLASLASPRQKRVQHPDESLSNYIAALRILAVDCKFGEALDRKLRDRFLCGMKDEGL